MRMVLAVVADKQSMHELGLRNPDTVFQKKTENNELTKYTKELTPDQWDLWRVHEELIEKTVKIADGDPIVLFDMGDIGQGLKYVMDTELESINPADHIMAAKYTFDPWMKIDNLVGVKLLAGTPAHDLGNAALPVIVSFLLQGEFPFKKVDVLYHGLSNVTDVGEVLVDYSHHGPGQSSRRWLEGNTARYYLRSLMWDDLINGRKPPKLVLRGDKHSIINEVVSIWANNFFYESRLLVMPPFCKLGDFARKVTKSISTIMYGGAIIVVEDGKILEPTWVTRTEDVRKKDDLTKWITKYQSKKKSTETSNMQSE
jgi:hypothetical protein